MGGGGGVRTNTKAWPPRGHSNGCGGGGGGGGGGGISKRITQICVCL